MTLTKKVIAAALATLLYAVTAHSQNYSASIHYNTYDAGGISRGGGIGEAYNQTSGTPPTSTIRTNIQDGDDLLSNFTRKRVNTAFPSTYNNVDFVAYNSQGKILLQLSDTTSQIENQTYRYAGAIYEDGAITLIPAGQTARFYDINDAGTAVGARFVMQDSQTGVGYWIPVYYRDGVVHDIPHPSGQSYGFNITDNRFTKDNSAFATAITESGLILCTGTETPEEPYDQVGPFTARNGGAGDDSVIFTYQIGDLTSTKIDAFFDSGAQGGYQTATDINASGEIVATQASFVGLSGLTFRSSNAIQPLMLYLPKENYGLPAGLNFIETSQSSSSPTADMREHTFFTLSDTGQIIAQTTFADITDFWDRGSFKDINDVANTPGFTVKRIVDMNDSGQMLVIATSGPDGPSNGRDYSLVLNGQTGIVVNVTTDGEDPDPDDDTIDSDSNQSGQQISLRAAIQAVNAGKGNTIRFAIPGSSVPKITLTKALPVLEKPVTIDGTTQAAGLVEIDGGSRNFAGLNLQAGNTTIRGLVMHGFVGNEGAAIRISGDGQNTIQGNYFGVDATGDIPQPLSRGVLINGSINNLIGGPTAADSNIIWATNIAVRIQGAGTNGNKIQNNRIGLGKSGDGLINSSGKKFIAGTGVSIAGGNNNEIGGSGDLGNRIAGDVAIYLEAVEAINGTKIINNRIGLNAGGTTIVGGEIGIFGIGISGGKPLSNTEVSNNKIAGHLLADIWFAGGGVSDTTINGNDVGLKFDSSGQLPTFSSEARTRYGIRTDRGNSFEITSNTVAGALYNIIVGGDIMFSISPLVDANNDGIPESGGDIEVFDPDSDPSPDDEPTNGKDTLVQNNTVGINASGEKPTDATQNVGITIYGLAKNATVKGNTVAGHLTTEIWIQDGSDHKVEGNTIGTKDGTGVGSQTGILVQNAIKTTIGSGNIIGRNEKSAIAITGEAAEITIQGNTIGTNSAGNTSWPNGAGILLQDGDDALGKIDILNNTIAGNTSGTGILIDTDTEDLTLTNNRIGLDSQGKPRANKVGISVKKGQPELISNTIAHNTDLGIAIIDTGSHIDMRSTAVFANGDSTRALGIAYQTPPHAPPSNLAALRTLPDSNGNVSVILALPALGANTGSPGAPAIPGEKATIEFFGNQSPGDAQGRVPLLRRDIDPTKAWFEQLTVSADSSLATLGTFTATVTRRGKTSEFSIHKMSQTYFQPELSFAPSASNKLVITWPTSGVENLFSLQQSLDLADNGAWTNSAVSTTQTNGVNRAEVAVQNGTQFFRLILDPAAIF